MMIRLRYIYSRWFVGDKYAGQDAGSSTPRLVRLAQGVRIENHKKTLTWRIRSRAPGDSMFLRHNDGEPPCSVSAQCSTWKHCWHIYPPPPKEHNSWHAVGSPCPFLPFEIGLFHAFMRFKFTISNYYHQLSLASFTSPCMCLYINMCTHMFYIYTWYIHVCTYAHIRKCTYTHKYIIRTYVFQLLHMYLFGRMVSLHCCIFLFGNLL